MINPSAAQESILKVIANSNQNISISGVAGCGKSTTLELIASQIYLTDSNARILYLAFNNEICADIEPKLAPLGVTVLTFHKWGNRSMKGHLKYRISEYKYQNLIQDYYQQYEQDYSIEPFQGLTVKQVVRLCEILRLWFCPISYGTVTRAMAECNYDQKDEWYDANLPHLTDFLQGLIKKGIAIKTQIDFCDMLLFPIAHKIPLTQFTHILVDESQDLSPIMHTMIKSTLKYARIINVGDRKQAINAFAGAMSNSFDALLELTGAVEMPLNKCYRCPDEVIKLAQKYVPEIEGTGKAGSVNRLSASDMLQKLKPSELIICRRNAPLVSLAFRLLANGHRVVIKGRKFSDYILYYVRKVQRNDVAFNNFLPALDKMITEMAEKTRDDDRVEMLNDVYQCLETMVEQSPDVSDYKGLTALVTRLFSEDTVSNSIVMCSFHRSKGLQNPTVWILLDKGELEPPGDNQESNLAYVAITRTLETLNLVPYCKDNTKKKTETKSEVV